jgi:hypothetical protein
VVASVSHSVFDKIGRLFRAKPEPEPGPAEDIVRLLKGEVFGSIPIRRPIGRELPRPAGPKKSRPPGA